MLLLLQVGERVVVGVVVEKELARGLGQVRLHNNNNNSSSNSNNNNYNNNYNNNNTFNYNINNTFNNSSSSYSKSSLHSNECSNCSTTTPCKGAQVRVRARARVRVGKRWGCWMKGQSRRVIVRRTRRRRSMKERGMDTITSARGIERVWWVGIVACSFTFLYGLSDKFIVI